MDGTTHDRKLEWGATTTGRSEELPCCCYSAIRTAVPLALTINIPPLCPVVIVS